MNNLSFSDKMAPDFFLFEPKFKAKSKAETVYKYI